MNRLLVASFVTLLSAPGLAGAAEADVQAEAGQYPADNSGRNVRDRGDETLTPVDQAQGSDADVKVTQQIRKAVVGDESLSMNAHNVKIITLDGKVTLRGVVDSDEEKAKVAQIAAQHAGGANRVTNQIEVAP